MTPFSPLKKGPKEGERVARGHFHERVGESPVHWLPPGVGFTQKPFSVSENGSYFIPISTMAPNISGERFIELVT